MKLISLDGFVPNHSLIPGSPLSVSHRIFDVVLVLSLIQILAENAHKQLFFLRTSDGGSADVALLSLSSSRDQVIHDGLLLTSRFSGRGGSCALFRPKMMFLVLVLVLGFFAEP